MSLPRVLPVILAVLFPLAIQAGEEPADPVLPGEEGRRAFDLLGELYAGKDAPPYSDALAQLSADEEAKRRKAGRYLHALLAQSFSDEENGRAEWRSLPYWGGGAESAAREFRKDLIEAFAAKASGPEALDAVAWLLSTELLASGPISGALVLRRIDTAGANALIEAHLTSPHSNAPVMETLITEAARRKLAHLTPQLLALQHHHRGAIRDAVAHVAATLGFADQLTDYEVTFSPTLRQHLTDLGGMLQASVPPDAKWVTVTYSNPDYRINGEPRKETVQGWLLDEHDEHLRILTTFAEESRLKKQHASVQECSLKEEAARLLKARNGEENAREALSREGGLTGQFEPRFVSLPELLVSLWCYQRGDPASAAAVLFPRLEATDDDRWIFWAGRDLLGHLYHQEMLSSFSHRRDYARTLALARHLAKPEFNGYQYQDRARELATQLAARGEDFATLTLPTKEVWAKLQQSLSREEQILYLAKRLRLLNCFQWGQPGGVSYYDEQFAPSDAGLPPWDDEEGRKRLAVINPCVALREMDLTVDELPTLVPFLADTNFMPTFSYWRNFHPSRTLHRVNWVVADLVNETARKALADPREFQRLDEPGRKALIATILKWCDANAGQGPEELILQTLKTARTRREFEAAMSEAVERKMASALDPLVARFAEQDVRLRGDANPARDDEFAEPGEDWREDLVEWCFELDTPEALTPARSWITHRDDGVRFFAALILLRRDKGERLEGLETLRTILEKARRADDYAKALDVLVATKREEALQVACGVFAIDHLESNWNGEAIVRRLFLAGRPEALKFLQEGLADASPGQYQNHERRDEVADTVVDWRLDEFEYGHELPAEVRTAKCAELQKWLAEQHALIRAGKKPQMILEKEDFSFAEWKIDAPLQQRHGHP